MTKCRNKMMRFVQAAKKAVTAYIITLSYLQFSTALTPAIHMLIIFDICDVAVTKMPRCKSSRPDIAAVDDGDDTDVVIGVKVFELSRI